jgi:nucleotide-binding universal stress UspA family protein
MKRQALLPLVTHPDANADAVAANAVSAACWLDADLHALAINVDIPAVSSALSRVLLNVPDMIKGAETLSKDRGEHLIARLKEAAGKAELMLTTASETASPELLAARAAQRARYFDIALLGWEATNPTSRSTTEAVVFGSGRPALILPELIPFSAPNTIALAWDGTRVAARALADAIPFLERAAKVLVLAVIDEKPLDEKEGAERLAGMLRKRGVAAEAVPIIAEDCPIGVTLQEHALERQAGLLVMGAYGHSRIRDFVLGGATDGVLSDLRLPVMMSH